MLNKRRYKNSRIKGFIIDHIRNNITEYFAMIIMLIIGIILGTIYINNINIEQKQEILTYISGFVEDTYNGIEIDFNNLLKTSIINNLIIITCLWLSGMTVIGMPIIYIIVSIKGFCMGYTISSIIASLNTWMGIKFAISTMFLQNLIMIPCILILGISGIKLYKFIVKDKRRENIKFEIFKYTIVAMIMMILSVFAAIIETYISSNMFRFVFI